MGAQQDKTHIANGTDEDLEVFVEYSGKSMPLIVPAGQYQCIDTDFRMNFSGNVNAQGNAGAGLSKYGPQWNANGTVDGNVSFIYAEPDHVRVTIRGPSGQCMREIQSDRSIVVQKSGSYYVIYHAKYGKIWQIE